jgi:hypothetical protein
MLKHTRNKPGLNRINRPNRITYTNPAIYRVRVSKRLRISRRVWVITNANPITYPTITHYFSSIRLQCINFLLLQIVNFSLLNII